MLSEQIMIERAGNFTASENHRLMAGWDIPRPVVDYSVFPYKAAYGRLCFEMCDFKSKPLVKDIEISDFKVTGKMIQVVWDYMQYEKTPQGLITYAEEKALESLFDYDESLNFSTVHTRNGDEREVECMELLSEKTGLAFQSIGDDQAHIHSNEVGCTPDGIVLDDLDLIETGAEVKCKSPLVHSRLFLIDTAEQLKENAFDHFVQIQTQMLVTETSYWYFAIFNPFAKKESMKFKHIIIERDDEFIKIMQKRIDIAKQIKADFLAELNKAAA